MSKQIQAVYERGVIRPLEPVALAEGERLDVILLTRDAPQTLAQALAHIAALPLENTSDSFSGQDHDAVLYPPNNSDDSR